MIKNNDTIILIVRGSGFIGNSIRKYLLYNYKKNKQHLSNIKFITIDDAIHIN